MNFKSRFSSNAFSKQILSLNRGEGDKNAHRTLLVLITPVFNIGAGRPYLSIQVHGGHFGTLQRTLG